MVEREMQGLVKTTDVAVDESYPTIQDIRNIFKNHGFDVTQAYEAGTHSLADGTSYINWHFIQFRGDIPDEGFRAFEVAVEHGLVPARNLRLEWECKVHRITGEGAMDREHPIWEMEFQTADCKGTRRNILCFCFL